MNSTVLLTDYAWPDDSVERGIVEGAGMRLISGPAKPSSAEAIAALSREHRPSAIMTCWAPVSADAIAASPELKIVARLGVGLDNIAVEAATRRGIWVSNVPDYCVEEVSDHAVGFALAWTRGSLTLIARYVRVTGIRPAQNCAACPSSPAGSSVSDELAARPRASSRRLAVACLRTIHTRRTRLKACSWLLWKPCCPKAMSSSCTHR
jgi:lactate dehydrogenase-like 2-hydroxyacid dehydrogenase